jgi:hypothetical protein
MRDSFVFYSSYADAITMIDDPASQMNVLKAIWAYAFREEEPEEGSLNKIETIIFSMARPTIEASKRNYENGLKGGRPKKTPLKTPLLTNDNVNVNDTVNVTKNLNVNDTVNDTDNDTVNVTKNLNNNGYSNINKKNTRFSKPTLEQVQAFCEKQNLGLDPVEFFDYYEKTNWENVYNWQSLVVAWNKRQIETYNKGKIKDSSDPYAGLR